MTRPQDSENVRSFMINSENRKLFLKTCDVAKTYQRQRSKLKFLTDCLKHRISPKTCRVAYRPIQEQSSEMRVQVEEIQLKASLALLKVNIKQEVAELGKRKTAFLSKMDSLRQRDPGVWAEVELIVKKALSRFWKACSNTHRMKLKALLVKSGRAVDSVLEGTPTLPTRATFDASASLDGSRPSFATPPSTPQHHQPHSRTSAPREVACDALPCRDLVTSTPVPGPCRRRSQSACSPVRGRSPPTSPFHGFPSPGGEVQPSPLRGRSPPTSPFHGFQSPVNPTQPPPPPTRLQMMIENLESSGPPPQQPVVPQPLGPVRQRRFVARNRYRRRQARVNRQIQHQSLVTNCSSFTITEAQDKLLSRGLKFVPTPQSINRSLMAARWQRFVRVVRWKEFWNGKLEGQPEQQGANGPKQLFKKVKANLPPYSPPQHLNTFIQAARDDVFLAPLNEAHPNLPLEEQEALKELVESQRRGEYKVVPNDKSGGVTVVDLADYKLVVQEQLAATYQGEDGLPQPYYRRTCDQHLQHLRSKAEELVQEGIREGFIHPDDAAQMVPEEGKPGRYYGLAKVHKARRCWPQVAGGRCPPLRPVVSGSGTVGEGISHWVDEQAKSEVKRIPTYLEDTRHLLQLIQEENAKGPQPVGTVPVTLDIVGMYTNVPIEDGLQAFAKVMEGRQDKTVPTWFLVKLMKFVAESSIFVFDSELFLQLLGVAMGSRSSPTFACLFVGFLEMVMLQAWERQGGALPHMLKRFIDDVFFLWQHGEQELERFVTHLNSFHRTMKFDVVKGESYDFTTRAINFLDVRIWIDEQGFIQTSLFEKPCRVVAYLLPSSCHPGFICRNIPYSLAYRLVRIESTQEGLERNLDKLKEELLSRGYSRGGVEAAMDRARGLSRMVALEKVPRPSNQRPVFCLPYDPRLPSIASILRKRHKALLSRDVDAREYFPEPPLVTYTRTKNLRDLVFRAQVPKILRRGLRPARPPGFFKCGKRSNCALCLHSKNATTYTCPFTGATARITQHITCQSTGVYLVMCKKNSGPCARLAPTYVGICGEGETSSFTHRLAGHLGTAIHNSQADTVKSVGRHFRLPGHEAHRDLVMLPIELVSARDPFLLRAREAYNIGKFQTEKRMGICDIEHGLNLDRGQQ